MSISDINLVNILLLLLSVLTGVVIYYLVNIGNTYVKETRKIKIHKEKLFTFLFLFFIFLLYRHLSNKYSIISDMLATMIISIILAYLLNPLITKLEDKKINRTRGIFIVYLFILALLFILSFLVLPKIGREFKKLFNNFPNYIDRASALTDELYRKYYKNFENFPDIFDKLEESLLGTIDTVQKIIVTGLAKFFNGIINTFSKVVNLVLIPILTFYFLRDKEYFKNLLISFIPKKHRSEIIDLAREMDESLGKFVRGRLLLALYVGVATTILLLIVRVDFAIVIGFITGIADIIPYIGPFLGFMPAVFFAFLDSPLKAFWVGLCFLAIQWVENNVLAPKIIGKSIGIHPLTILISLIIGGGMYGVVGMIFAVPFVAVSKILIDFFYKKLKKRKK